MPQVAIESAAPARLVARALGSPGLTCFVLRRSRSRSRSRSRAEQKQEQEQEQEQEQKRWDEETSEGKVNERYVKYRKGMVAGQAEGETCRTSLCFISSGVPSGETKTADTLTSPT
eukprot:753039-Hanusia_phi.AAC.2